MKLLKEQLRLTGRCIALVWSTSPWLLIATVVSTLLGTAATLAMAYVAKEIIDAAQAQSVDRAMYWVAAEFGLVLGKGALQKILELSRSVLGNRLAFSVQADILVKASGMDLEQIEDPSVADKLSQANREATARPVSILGNILEGFRNVLSLGGYAVILVTYSPWMALGIALAALPAAVAEALFSQKIFGLQNWRSPFRRKLNYFDFLLTRDANAKELKVFSLGNYFLGRHREQSENFLEEDLKIMRQRLGWTYGLSILADVAFYVSFVLLVISAAKAEITLGSLALYMLAFRQGQSSLEGLFASIKSLYENNLYISNLFEFLEIQRPVWPGSGGTHQAPVKEGIVFDHVSFKYPGSETEAVQDLNFHIPRGQSIAIVGFNGSGKTTLIKLLCRFYRPTSGHIYIDGKDLADWTDEELWPRISAVFQDFVRYQLTARENVGLGDLRKVNDAAAVDRAVEKGGALEVMQGLPEGADTQLGRWFHKGQELSGGQWQKLALARAFIREDADILILDEPTSALDAQAESDMYERFRQLTRGKTSLLITHRLSTARLADTILMMREGKILERGTHDQLTAGGGEYARLFQLQAAGFR